MFYDDEETEVLVEIAYLACELVIKEGVQEILRLIKA